MCAKYMTSTGPGQGPGLRRPAAVAAELVEVSGRTKFPSPVRRREKSLRRPALSHGSVFIDSKANGPRAQRVAVVADAAVGRGSR